MVLILEDGSQLHCSETKFYGQYNYYNVNNFTP